MYVISLYPSSSSGRCEETCTFLSLNADTETYTVQNVTCKSRIVKSRQLPTAVWPVLSNNQRFITTQSWNWNNQTVVYNSKNGMGSLNCWRSARFALGPSPFGNSQRSAGCGVGPSPFGRPQARPTGSEGNKIRVQWPHCTSGTKKPVLCSDQ